MAGETGARVRGVTIPGATAAQVPQTGAIPPRPANLRYISALIGTDDANQLTWDSESTDDVTTWVIESSSAPDMRTSNWETVETVSNAGTANVYTIVSQVSDRWFRVKGRTARNDGYYAGPVSNIDPARTITVKGYFLRGDGTPVPGGQVELVFDTSEDQVSDSAYRTYVTQPVIAAYEESTGFWEAKISTAMGLNVKIRKKGDGTNESSAAKDLSSSYEDVFDTELTDA